METKHFNLFSARREAETYVEDIYAGTTCASAVCHIAVDPQQHCLTIDSVSKGHEGVIRQQSACIFRVRYRNGRATVTDTEYINESVM